MFSPAGHSETGVVLYTGLLMEGNREEPGIRKWKVNSEPQAEALDKEEDGPGTEGTTRESFFQEEFLSAKLVIRASTSTAS